MAGRNDKYPANVSIRIDFIRVYGLTGMMLWNVEAGIGFCIIVILITSIVSRVADTQN
jgi:hypothetical protein